MFDMKFNFITLVRFSFLIMFMILFLLIPLVEVDLMRQAVFKWLAIYLFSILGILAVNDKWIHSKKINSLILILSPYTWLIYGAAAIYYIRLFSMDWYWFVVYPGFVFGLVTAVFFMNKDIFTGMNIRPLLFVLCLVPTGLGLIKCLLWGGDIISWNKIILLGLMNFTGAIQVIFFGAAVALGMKDNMKSENVVSES